MDVWHFLGAALVGLWVGGVLVLTRLPETALSWPLRGFAIGTAMWALGDVVAALATDLFWKQIGVAIFYSGVIFVPPLWWTLAVRWAEDRGVELPFDSHRWTRIPLLYAGAMWAAMLSNPWHGGFIVPVVGGLNIYGPLWWWMALPSYCLILGVLVLELWILSRFGAPHTRRQAGVMIAASGVTLAANLAYVSGATSGMNATLPVLAVSGVILTVGMIWEGLFGVLPVALPIVAARDPDGIVVLRRDGGTLYANQRAREILSPIGVAASSPLLATLASRLHEADGAPVAPRDSQPSSRPESRHDAQNRPGWEDRWWRTVLQPGGALFCYGDEDVRWLRISAQPVWGRGQRLLAHCLRVHDATQEHNAGIEVQRARRLESVAQLALGVAHDFQNLLTVVRGNAELLIDEVPARPEIQRKLHRVLRASEQATELADQLQLYAGAAEPTRTTLDLSELVRDMFELFDSSFFSSPGGETPNVELDLAPEPVTIEADETQLHQLALNLLVNARDELAGERGTIRVQTGSNWLTPERVEHLVAGRDRPAGRYGYLRVSDTGSGMDATTQERIFEPFFSTKGKHRGIGLATVFGIVQSHGALLELQSCIGRGTTFSVYFSMARSDGAPENTNPQSV